METTTASESATLTITATEERLHLTGDGTVWLVWPVGNSTDSGILGHISDWNLWEVVPEQLMGSLANIEERWQRTQQPQTIDPDIFNVMGA